MTLQRSLGVIMVVAATHVAPTAQSSQTAGSQAVTVTGRGDVWISWGVWGGLPRPRHTACDCNRRRRTLLSS